MIIWVPVQIALYDWHEGAQSTEVGSHVSATGLYYPPVLVDAHNSPQTIISLPVHTAVCPQRADGAPATGSGRHVSVVGLYLAPVLTKNELLSIPPHTIISVPVHTALCLACAEGAPVIPTGVQVSVNGS